MTEMRNKSIKIRRKIRRNKEDMLLVADANYRSLLYWDHEKRKVSSA